MTYTKDNETTIAGLAVVLKLLKHFAQPVALKDWLSGSEVSPVWVPLAQHNGVVKVMSLAEPQGYSSLLQSICQQLSGSTVVEWQSKSYELTGVEVHTHDLYRLQIPLSPTETLPSSMGRSIHAQFFQWLANADPSLAEDLHQQSQLPVTLSLSSGSRPKICISLLQSHLLTPLLMGISKDLNREIQLAGITCSVRHSIEIIEASRFEEIAHVVPQEVIELRFLTPTSFKQEQHVQPFLLPELVFSNLHRRWNAFAPEHLQLSKVNWQGLVAMYELRTKTFRMKAAAEIGSVGWVRYRFPDPEQARIATILAHFARFAGVGRKTAMGMGQAQLKR